MILGLIIGYGLLCALIGWVACAVFARSTSDSRRGGYLP